MSKHFKRLLIGFLKIAFAFGALSYVLLNTNISEIKGHIMRSEWIYLLMAYISMHISNILSAHRLKIYFAANDMRLPEKYVIPAMYINSFFNTVLPGGIGGDGYLALLFRKHFNFPAMRSVKLILNSRMNGLFFLNFFLYIVLWFSSFAQKFPELKILIIVLLILQFPVYALVSRLLFKEKLKTFMTAGLFSLSSQVFFVLSAYLAFKAINISTEIINYLALYLSSSIAAIIPITPGGVGLRELIFYKGSIIINLDPHLAVAGSLTYYAVYFSVALTGLFFYLFDSKMHKRRERTWL